MSKPDTLRFHAIADRYSKPGNFYRREMARRAAERRVALSVLVGELERARHTLAGRGRIGRQP